MFKPSYGISLTVKELLNWIQRLGTGPSCCKRPWRSGLFCLGIDAFVCEVSETFERWPVALCAENLEHTLAAVRLLSQTCGRSL